MSYTIQTDMDFPQCDRGFPRFHCCPIGGAVPLTLSGYVANIHRGVAFQRGLLHHGSSHYSPTPQVGALGISPLEDWFYLASGKLT